MSIPIAGININHRSDTSITATVLASPTRIHAVHFENVVSNILIAFFKVDNSGENEILWKKNCFKTGDVERKKSCFEDNKLQRKSSLLAGKLPLVSAED